MDIHEPFGRLDHLVHDKPNLLPHWLAELGQVF